MPIASLRWFARLLVGVGLLVSSVPLLSALGSPSTAFADTVPVAAVAPTAPVETLTAPPADPALMDPGALVAVFVRAVEQRNWPLVAALFVFAAVLALRTFGSRLHPWFDSRRAGVVLAVGAAGVGAVLAPLLAGAPWSWELLGGGVTAAFAAMGVVSGWRALRKGGTSESKAERRFARSAKKDAGKLPPTPPPAATALLLVLGLTLGAGQAAAQTYVRPSKGAPITAVTADTLASTTTTPLYDWTAFTAAEIVITASAPLYTCTRTPFVNAYIFPTKAGATQGSGSSYPAPNNSGTGVLSQSGSLLGYHASFEQRIAGNYAQFAVGSLAATNPTMTTVCTFTVQITPLPFLTETAADWTLALVAKTIPESPTSATNVFFGLTGYNGASQRTIYLENTSTQVVYCGFSHSTTPSSYSFTLTAANTADDGTGGKISFPISPHPLFCVAAPGATGYLRGFVK